MDPISEALFGIHILFAHMFSLTSCSLTAPLIRELFQPLCCLQADNVLRSPFMILWIDAHALHKATKPGRHHEILKLRHGRSSTSTFLCAWMKWVWIQKWQTERLPNDLPVS